MDAYKHVSRCGDDMHDDEMRVFTPLMRVIQIHKRSIYYTLFARKFKARDPIFVSRHKDKIPPELQAEISFRFKRVDECMDILFENADALQRVLDIEFERNDPTAADLLDPFVALAKVVRARKAVKNAMQEIQCGL